jgi:predicted O-methyltransferase YrrM
MSYDFTADWFSGNIPTWTKIVWAFKPRFVLEIGSYEGRSAVWLINNTPLLTLHCVDIWEDAEIEARFDSNVKYALSRTPAVAFTKLKMPSSEALISLRAGIGRKFDLIYIDGSHTAPDVLSDAVLAWPLLNVGGVMIFDDYLWRSKPDALDIAAKQNPLDEPKIAIDAFINVYQQKLKIISHCPLYQVYLQKVSE